MDLEIKQIVNYSINYNYGFKNLVKKIIAK